MHADIISQGVYIICICFDKGLYIAGTSYITILSYKTSKRVLLLLEVYNVSQEIYLCSLYAKGIIISFIDPLIQRLLSHV